MPTTSANEKPWSTSPPKAKSASTVRNVSPEVSTVRLNVLVDAAVDDLGETLAARHAQVLADTVKDHDGVIHRITNQRQDGGDHGQADFFVEEREEADRDQRVMEDGYDRCHAIDQLKAEPEVDQHAQQRVERRQARLLLKLVADRRPNCCTLRMVAGLL